jgi:hypothetical protein
MFWTVFSRSRKSHFDGTLSVGIYYERTAGYKIAMKAVILGAGSGALGAWDRREALRMHARIPRKVKVTK